MTVATSDEGLAAWTTLSPVVSAVDRNGRWPKRPGCLDRRERKLEQVRVGKDQLVELFGYGKLVVMDDVHDEVTR
jgi:hypothetical protein